MGDLNTIGFANKQQKYAYTRGINFKSSSLVTLLLTYFILSKKVILLTHLNSLINKGFLQLLSSGRLQISMIQKDGNQLMGNNKNTLLDKLSEQLSKSKADLVTDIENQISIKLGMDVRQAFGTVATAQQIRGGAMNLDRAHKSMLVLLAHVLSHDSPKSELLDK